MLSISHHKFYLPPKEENKNMKKGSNNWILLIWPCTWEKGSRWSSWHITTFLYNFSMTHFMFVHVISSPPFRVHMSSPVAFLIWGSDLAHLPKHSKKQIPVLSLWSLCFLGGIFWTYWVVVREIAYSGLYSAIETFVL